MHFKYNNNIQKKLQFLYYMTSASTNKINLLAMCLTFLATNKWRRHEHVRSHAVKGPLWVHFRLENIIHIISIKKRKKKKTFVYLYTYVVYVRFLKFLVNFNAHFAESITQTQKNLLCINDINEVLLGDTYFLYSCTTVQSW